MVSAEQARRHDSDDEIRGRRRPGRPRNASYDRAILDAAVDILVEKGYSGLTIDGVAARTGVGRPTIYRRWRSKAALAIAVLDEVTPLTIPADTGSLREDLRAFSAIGWPT